jgi:MoxR-like ATPase
MLGNPGTAKSLITYDLCSRIENGQYFQWMLNKTSDPSELLGPYSIKQMEQDRFLRVTTGKLPEAHIAFIDECYKANAPVLNILLPIMNEKIFYNDGKPNDIPLITMIGASNEPPEEESLAAFHDRFLFRIRVNYVKDAGNKKRMYNNYIDKRAGLLDLAQKASITIDEIKMLNEATKRIGVPKDIVNKFIKFINDLDHQAIHVSDRRQNECFKVMQGAALLANRKQVGLDDFKALIHVLWEKEEHIPIIESTILKMVNPYDDKFKEFKENFKQIQYGIDSTTDQTEKSRKALEAKGAIEKLASKVNKLLNDAAKNGKDITEYTDFRNEIVAYGNQMVAAALGQSVLGGSSAANMNFFTNDSSSTTTSFQF